MSLSQDDLRAFLPQCDPNRSLGPEDPRYVSLDALRGDGARSCIEILERNIVTLNESCQLFTGFTGTGKTTELRRLQGRLGALRDLPTRVVYIDFNDYWDKYSPPAITDVLRIIAYCLDCEATLAEGDDPEKKPGYVRKFFDFLSQTDVKLKETGFNLYGTKLMLELKDDANFRRRAEAALEGRFQQFAAQAHASMTESVARLKKAKDAYVQRIVVIADSIEQLEPLREEERRAMEESVEMLFVNHARHLRLPRSLVQLPCHVVYTFPIWLRYRRADVGTNYDGEPLVLPMVKIAEPGGAPVPAGIQKLTELVERRLDVAKVFGADREATLAPLLRASGGYPRDLLRMVRSLLMESRDFPVGPEDTERVITRLGEDYSRALYATHLDALAAVAETHALPRASDEERAAFARLLDRWFVLAYRNGTEWYDLHPMIRRDPMVDARLRKKKKPGKG
jgi:hypothetical protein